MTPGRDEVLVIRDGVPRSLRWRSFREGLLGSTLEDSLQRLLEEFPAALAGAQMEPESDDPPRFVLLRREARVSSWSLDHLLADQFGVPTLLEAKLMENPESRRAVIGQVMDYAANAYDAWGRGRVREIAAEYWARRGTTIEEILTKTFRHDFDVEEFWERFERNLENGRVRLIIAADELQPEVRRVIEYLNERLHQVEVYGLELACFTAADAAEIVVVPRLIGMTQAARDRKGGASHATTDWTIPLIRNAIDESTTGGQRFLDLLEWTVANDCFMGSTAIKPSFSVHGATEKRVLSVYWNGGIWVWGRADRFPDVPARDEVLNRLFAAGLLVREFDPEASDGAYLTRGVERLSAEEMAALKEALLPALGSR